MVLVCGVFLSPRLVAGCRQLLETLVGRGFATALDTGWPDGGWDGVRSLVESWLPSVDHVLFNDLETMSMAGRESLDGAVEWFRAHLRPTASLVVKRGAEGAAAWRGDERVDCPVLAVEVIDTIGVGDAFNAGYLFGCATGLDLAASLRLAVTTACTAISTSPRRFVPAV